MSLLTQIVGLVVAIYVLIIWLLNRKLDSFTDNIFLFASITAIISIVLDIMCQLTATQALFAVSEDAKTLVLDAYLISIPLTLAGIAFYINRLAFNNKVYEKIRLLLTILILISSLITIVLDCEYTYHSNLALPVGPAVTYTYVITAIVGLSLLIELIIFRKKLNHHKLLATIIWISCFLVSGVLQFILISTLDVPIVSLAIGCAVLILYSIVENPGNKFDYQIGSFHYESFVEYISEIINNKEIQSIAYLSIVEKNTNNLYYVKGVFDNIVLKYENDNEIKIFAGHTNELIITSKTFAGIQTVTSNIGKCINDEIAKHSKEISFNSSIVLFPEISFIDSYEIIRSIFDSYKVKPNSDMKSVEINTITKEISDKFAKEVEIARTIDYAIKNDNIVVYYQPLYNRFDKTIIDAEAIVKIVSPNGTELSPIDYFGIAEKYQKFNEIDEIAFRHICKTIKKIIKLSSNLGSILIRISVQELERENATLEFIKTIKEEGINAKNICLEITNANTISNKDVLLQNIKELQEIGFCFAIGGFGSGESNLNYFIDLPLQIVKFDLSVLTNAMKDKNAAFIMKDVTELAHSLDYKVISVGVDKEEEKEFAEECGVEMMLGSLFSDVLSEDQFIMYLKEGGNK